jgi:hypothetical protein
MRKTRLLPAAAAALAISVPAVLLAANAAEALVAKVGPGFTISLTKADGARVLNLDPGSYTLNVDDQGDVHSFHLRGPGVDVKTDIEAVGPSSFEVALVDGSYQFFCDLHPDQMRGAFTVGTPPPPPPPPPPPATPRLFASVGTSITLKNAAGTKVKSVKAGTYQIVVRDTSTRANFHLRGQGIDRKTGVAARGTFTWRVRFAKGKLYTYRSDAQPTKLRSSFNAT